MKIINRLLKYLILPLIIAGAFFVWSLPRITTDYNFNADELIYLSRSNYWTAFKSGDFRSPLWSQDWVTYDQPQLTNYIYASIPGDRNLIDSSNSPCQKPSDTNFYNTWSCLDGKPLSSWGSSLYQLKTMVTKGRVLATGISALAIATTYYLGLVVAGPLAGLIASLYLGYFTYFQGLSTMIMEDQTLLVFLNLQFIATLLLIKNKKYSLLLLTTIGITTGLAFSTKLSAAIPTLIIYLCLAFISIKNKTVKFSHLVISALLAASIFIALHPFLWSNPVGGFFKMITWRTTQIASHAGSPDMLHGITDKVVYTLSEGFSSWEITNKPLTIVSLVTVAFISLITLLKTNISFSFISIVNIVLFVLMLPLKWNRYLLPIMPAIAVYIGSFPITLSIIIKKIKSNLEVVKNFLSGSIVALILVGILSLIPLTGWLSFIVLIITLLLIIQGYLVTRAMLYGFSHRASKIIETQSATETFTLVVPARDEATVIGHTISALGELNYPNDMYEVLVMIRADDYATIIAAENAITNLKSSNIRIIQVDGDANNKAYSLNIAVRLAKHGVIGIFDAEDEPNKNILQKINDYLVINPTVGAVQAPVHLTNINSSWYASLNAIEYYYWFRSVLPYLATKRIIPLGGNTIFTKKEIFGVIGNYDESCLTEDADIGIRLAANNISVGVLDDSTIATTEEAPGSEIDIIRQRSRWDQGYLQVLNKGHWMNLTPTQKLYALYTLTQPLFRHLSFLNMIIAPLLSSLGHVPLWLVLLSFVPGYFLILQLGLYVLGLSELAKLHNIRVTTWRYMATLLAFIPYQALLTLATLRAFGKIALGNNSWDKTNHTNAHRPSLAILER